MKNELLTSNYAQLLNNFTSYQAYKESINIIAGNKVWSKIKSEGTKEDYEFFVINYPNSVHRTKAINQIEEITNEDKVWQKARKKNLASSYLSYIEKYPKGVYLTECKKRYEQESEIEKKLESLITWADENELAPNRLPQSIEELKNLTELDLEHCKLTELPESIQYLTKLTSLNISFNRLEEIPEWVGNLKYLKYLHFRFNKYSSVPESIGQLTKLIVLDFNCERYCAIRTSLPKSLDNLTHLDDESKGKLQKIKSAIIEIEEELWKDISYCIDEDLKDTDLLFLEYINGYENGKYITECKNIYDSKKRKEEELKPVLESIREWNNKNNISEYYYPTGVKELISTEEINLYQKNINDFPEWLVHLPNLTRLNIIYSQLTELPESIGELTNLTELHLENNKLTKLPESIGKLKNLTMLDLSHNQLTELPESIGRLTNLTTLWLLVNQLTKLPESIGKLTNLTRLNIDSNQLTELPRTINHCVKLNNLDEIKGKVEADKWLEVEAENSAESYNNYIQIYPNGRYISEATWKISEATQRHKSKTSKVNKFFHDVFK